MATRPHNSSKARARLVSDESIDSMADTLVADSFGPSRVVLKKKKKKGSKWQRFDLSGSTSADNEAEDEVISNPASSAPTRASTPNAMLTFDPFQSPPLSASLESTSSFLNESATPHPLLREHTATLSHKGKVDAIKKDLNLGYQLGSESEFEGSASDSFEVQLPLDPGSLGDPNSYSDQGHTPGYYSTPTQRGFEASFGGSEYIDDDPTPRVTQGGFPAAFVPQPSLSPSDWTTFDDLDRSDTQSTKDRTETVLARLNASMLANKGKEVILEDVFDSVDWDPEMPKGPSLTASPEPIPLELKPVVAYTTVGSRFDPSAVPQFSAPNRIQREGANRRPVPLSMMQSRQFDGAFYNQQRGPPPPLNMSNSMQYAQQLGRNPSNSTMPSSAGSSSGSVMSRSISGHLAEQTIDSERLGLRELTEREEKAYSQQLNIQNVFSYDGSGYDNVNKPIFKAMPIVDENRNPYSVRELLEDDARRRSNSYQGPLQGMDKMQTLQRLSKFDNPMQEACRTRLAELSVKGKPVNSSASLTPYDIAVQDQKSSVSSAEDVPFDKLVADMGLAGAGELNRSYQFPPPGLTPPQANPLLAAFNSANSQQSFISSRPPGYPQPLTAGPPRQRQFPPGFGQVGASQPNSHQTQPPETAVEATKSRWGMAMALPAPAISNYTNAGSLGGAPPLFIENRSYPSTKIQDTLPAQEAMMKYYPNGLPPDFNHKWQAITTENKRAIGEHVSTTEEVAAAKKKELDDWFYQGQRRYVTMKSQDHIEELEMGNKQSDKFGNIAPPKRISHPIIPALITPEQAKNISTPEAAGPLLDASFGTLLAYAETSTSSRSRLSNFVTPAPHLIDNSSNGNDSSFGEDWGPPAGPTGSRTSAANSSRASSIAASSRGGGVKISLFDRFSSGKYNKT